MILKWIFGRMAQYRHSKKQKKFLELGKNGKMGIISIEYHFEYTCYL